MTRTTQALRLIGLLACTAGLKQPCFGEPASSAKGISAQERHALVALYEATEGSHWKNHGGWLGLEGTECSWYGVECEPTAAASTTVIHLDLSENNLNGRIPDAIGQLVHLQTLFLFHNNLSGGLPEPLIRQWLSGSLWVTAEAPLLTDVSEIDYEYAATAILCAQHRVVLHSDSAALRAYTEFVMTLPFRQKTEQSESAELNSNAYGTRAKGTERLVYRILQSPEYRTLEIVTRFLEVALPTADRRTLPARAQNILDRIEKYGESGIPRNELDLLSWSDLAVTGVGVKGEGRRKTRHFKPCKQCGVRFLPNRASQAFHAPNCRVRWNRNHVA